VPEYTKKTGKLTKRSKKDLDEIRAQVFGESLLAEDLEEYVEVFGFIGLTYLFYEGINPAVLGLITAIAGVLEDIGETLTEYYEVTVEYGGDIVRDIVTGKFITDILRGEAPLEIKAKSEEEAKKIVEKYKRLSNAELEKDIERREQSIRHRTYLINKGELSDKTVELYEKRNQTDQGFIDAFRARLDAGTVSESQAKWIAMKADMRNWMIAMGEAYCVMIFLKSYSFHKARQDTKLIG
jgi:hypothetical protein